MGVGAQETHIIRYAVSREQEQDRRPPFVTTTFRAAVC